MAKVIIVGGFGPGISSGVAEVFGAKGFSVAIVGRSAERLAAGVTALAAKGITAKAFPCDLGKPAAVRAMVRDVRTALGPIDVLQWTAYSMAAPDVTIASDEEMSAVFDVPVVGFMAAVQEALPDLKAAKGAVLMTNGGFGNLDAAMDAAAVQWGAMGVAIANAAKTKLIRVLNKKLGADGVFVGQLMVMGVVKGTFFDQHGQGNLEPLTLGQKFWDLYQARADVTTNS